MGLAALIVPMIPGVIWLWIIYRTDWYEPEPKRLVLATFGLGIVAIAPAFGGERLAGAGLSVPALHRGRRRPPASPRRCPMAIGCFLVIGPCEELGEVPRGAPVRLSQQRVQRAARRHHLRRGGRARLRQPRERALRDRLAHAATCNGARSACARFWRCPATSSSPTTWGYALGRQKFDRELSRVADGGPRGAAARALRLLAHVPPDAAAHPALHVADGANHRAPESGCCAQSLHLRRVACLRRGP